MSGLGVPLDFYYHIFSGFMIRSILFHVLQHDLDERVVLQIERIKNLQNQCNDDLVLLWWLKQMLLFGRSSKKSFSLRGCSHPAWHKKRRSGGCKKSKFFWERLRGCGKNNYFFTVGQMQQLKKNLFTTKDFRNTTPTLWTEWNI